MLAGSMEESVAFDEGLCAQEKVLVLKYRSKIGKRCNLAFDVGGVGLL